MEYAVIILLLINGIVKYDFRRKVDKKNTYYKMIYILMVLMSGLVYRVGADLVFYETSYYEYKDSVDLNLANIVNISREQFGWTLLSVILCKLGANFTIFKLIQAVFLQFAVFITFKKYTTYRYVALLLYFVFLYPHVNFNVLRESFAIGFFLLSIPYILNRKWIKYYLFIFFAFLFHTGAILLAFFPLLLFLDFNSVKKVLFTAGVTFIASILLARSNITNILLDITYTIGNTSLIEQSEFYLLRDRYTVTGITNIAKSLLFFVINILPLYYVAKKGNIEQKKLIPLAFLYIIVSLVNNFVPIAYRYKDYTYVLFHLVLSIFLVDYSKKYLMRRNFILVLLLFGLYFYSVRSYFSINRYYGAPSWVQYYPYHSVIDKGKSPIRESIFY